MRKRPNGDGSISKRKDGIWRATFNDPGAIEAADFYLKA